MDDGKPRYHHGDLRAALLAAGEAELAASGAEAFSLRRVARRVGVSHSAPAHHFGDAEGLLDALATEGFRRFLAAMEAREAEAPRDDFRARVIGSGLGYIDFAEASPALFRLMFTAKRKPTRSPELVAAGAAAFRHLADGVTRLRGASPFEDAAAMVDVMAAWSMVHGLAELMIFHRLPPLADDREAVLAGIIGRSLP